MIGQSIAHYRIVEKLGRGGMGEVFLAEDLSLNRKAALKFLPEEDRADPAGRKRFLREARSAAGLDHPLARYSPGASPLIEHTVRRMLAKDPDLRYQSVHEVRTDLTDWEEISVPRAEERAPQNHWKQILAWVAAASVLMGAVIGVLVWNLKPESPAASIPLTRLAMALPDGETLAQGVLSDVALSPDGSYLAQYAAVRGGKAQIYLRTMDQLQATPIPGTEDGSGPSRMWVESGRSR